MKPEGADRRFGLGFGTQVRCKSGELTTHNQIQKIAEVRRCVFSSLVFSRHRSTSFKYKPHPASTQAAALKVADTYGSVGYDSRPCLAFRSVTAHQAVPY
jgi:hypothetical protein